MNGKLALDTNAVIAYQRGDPLILALIDDAKELFIAAPVLGELAYGALASDKPVRNLNSLLQFVGNCNILALDTKASFRYAYIRKKLRDQGEPIPENDIWIAAICMEHDLPVLTRDKHFSYIPDLKIISW